MNFEIEIDKMKGSGSSSKRYADPKKRGAEVYIGARYIGGELVTTMASIDLDDYDIRVIGGHDFRNAVARIIGLQEKAFVEPDKNKTRQLRKLAFKHMGEYLGKHPSVFEDMLKQAREEAKIEGRNEIRNQFSKMMQEEW